MPKTEDKVLKFVKEQLGINEDSILSVLFEPYKVTVTYEKAFEGKLWKTTEIINVP